MRVLSRVFLAALALALAPVAGHANCPAQVGGVTGPFSNQRLIGTETADDALIVGGCVDGYQSYNLWGNGDFFFDGRHEGAAVTATSGVGPVMGPDRWQLVWNNGLSGAGNPTVARAALSAGLVLTSREAIVTASATTPSFLAAGLQMQFQQQTEGQELQDLGFGNLGGGAQTVSGLTAQIYFKPSAAGIYYGFAQNAALSRSYVVPCRAPAAVWTLCTFPIPPDGVAGAGLWNTTPGTIGMIVGVALTCGSNLQAAAIQQWQAGNFTCFSDQTQMANTAGATAEFAGGQLVRGGPLSSFQADPIWLADRKLGRFYRKTFPIGIAPGNAAGLAGSRCVAESTGTPASLPFDLSPPMFAAPGVATFNPAANNSNWRDVTRSLDSGVTVDLPNSLVGKSPNGVLIWSQPSTGNDIFCIHATFDTGL